MYKHYNLNRIKGVTFCKKKKEEYMRKTTNSKKEEH